MRGYPEHLHEVINEDLQEDIYNEALDKNSINFQKCSICEELVNSDMHHYCPVCGNKIDWNY